MQTKKPRSLKSVVLNELSEFASLSQRACDNHSLQKSVCDILPDSLHNHVVAVDIDGETLTVVCDSAPWATRIRFYSNMLLQNLVVDHNSTDGITTVAVKVRPHWQPN